MDLIQAQSLHTPGGDLPGPIGFSFNTIGDVITKAIPFVFAFAGFGLLLMIISAGFTLLTSAGDSKKIESGKQQLTYAIVGFFVIFASFWIVQLVGKIFGIQEVQQIFH